MSIKIIQDRLQVYQPRNQLETENAITEITQEIALSGLARAGFFKNGIFLGGTSLRILYGLNRFSEDLDFSLTQPNPDFEWQPYLKSLQSELEAYGYQIQIQDRSSENAVKSVFIKDHSIGKLLILQHKKTGIPKSIKIKFEIDTNPPLGGTVEQKYIDFPLTVPVVVHDLPSLFAGKSHALLCRNWEKGRDWYDFVWYVSRKIKPNFKLLSNALEQNGPWKEQGIRVTPQWYLETLRKKVIQVNWNQMKQDVVRFLKQSDQDLVNTWEQGFFLDRVKKMEDYLLLERTL